MKNKKFYLVGFLSAIFIILLLLVVFKKTVAIDNYVHDAYMHLYSYTTTRIMKVFTFLGSTGFIIFLASFIFGFFFFRGKRNYAYCEGALLIISTLINNIIKIIIRRPRPDYIMVIEKTFSFPSGHTMAATTVYGFLIYLIIRSNISKENKWILSSLLSLLIFLIASSRIYLGAHFFSDVLAGAVLSLLILVIFAIINDKKKYI